jgi:hypothetical protein
VPSLAAKGRRPMMLLFVGRHGDTLKADGHVFPLQ